MSEENSNGYLEGGPSDAKSQKKEVQEDSKASPQLEAEPGAVQIKPGPSDAKSQKMEVQEDSKASPQLEAEPGAVQIKPGPSDAKSQKMEVQEDSKASPQLEAEPGAVQIKPDEPSTSGGQAMLEEKKSDELALASASQPILTGPIYNTFAGGDFQTAFFGPVTKHNDLTLFDNRRVTNLHLYHQHAPDSRKSGRQNELSISGGQAMLEKKKSDKFILPAGITVFKSKIIYKADSGVTIYEGEKATVDGVDKMAVKFLPHSKKAMREAKSLKAIRYHPNVVGIYDTAIHTTELGKYIFIAMERCSQETLSTYVSQNKNFDCQQAINHSTQIISGLEYIHSRGIAHRDLKPNNILFLEDGGHGQVKIADFGVSKNYLTDPQVTVNVVTGTEGFIAPELIKCEAVEDFTKCDIFSLGILLHFRLSNGKHPYGEKQWLWKGSIAEGVEPDLNQILLPSGYQRNAVLKSIRKMLEHDPANRPTASKILNIWKNDIGENIEKPASKAAAYKNTDEGTRNPSASTKTTLTKSIRKHYEQTEMTAVTEDFSEIPVSAQATFSRCETDHDSASSFQPSEKLTSEVNVVKRHLAKFEEKTSKTLEEIKQQLLRGACGKQRREHEALSLGSGKIPDGSVKLEGPMIYFCKEPKLHETKPIYKGWKITSGEPTSVVVKLVNYSKNALREAESLRCIDFHRNVVRIYDSGIYKADLLEYVYIAMEPCSVENLYDYINQLESFNPKQAIEHSTQIISGTKYIHEKRVAHRDMKAHNVLFDADAGYEQIKIVDFGLSKKYLDDPHMTTQPGGTMVTSAPEIIKGIKERDEAKCDIFSLGILLFFVLSKGKHPYGQLQENWSSNIANDKNLDLSGIELPNGRKRVAILCILKKMLQHNSVKRPTAKKVLEEWNRRVLDIEDPTLEIDYELEDNMSAPLSKSGVR